jgi:hypothetical protein
MGAEEEPLIIDQPSNKVDLPQSDNVDLKIQPLSGTIRPLSLDGGDDPVTQCVIKINEIVDWINSHP